MSELWHLQCRSERYEVPGDAAALPFLTFALQHENIINCCRICFAWLYSTLLPEPRAAKLNCAGAHFPCNELNAILGRVARQDYAVEIRQ